MAGRIIERIESGGAGGIIASQAVTPALAGTCRVGLAGRGGPELKDLTGNASVAW